MSDSARYCEYCGKCLCKIGTDRKNGKGSFKDWNDRKYHKKCFKSINQSRLNIFYLHDFKDDNEALKKDLKSFNDYLIKRADKFEAERNLKGSK